ncbi:MAG: Uma2 family endonuclease [Chloroflexota bacterium]
MTTPTLIQDDIRLTLPGDSDSWPLQGAWRYADYERLPNDGRRYEIIEGVLFVANAPSYEHQFTSGEISFHLQVFVKQNNLGVVVSAPFEVHLAASIRPVQPDILFIHREQLPNASIQFFDGVPNLIVEVISPSSIRRDRNVKFDQYEQAGVAEYWLADPKTRSVEVYTLSAGGEYALLGQYTEDEEITSNVLEGLTIVTSQLFV